MMRNPGARSGRNATYGAILALAIALTAAGPAQAQTSTQIAGDSTMKVTATARTNDVSFEKGKRLHARTNVTYEARILGLPLPLTAAYVNSFPLHFGKPRLDETNADLRSKRYRVMRDSWLQTDQWMVTGDKGFWGTLSITIKGSALAQSKGQRFFHAGTGTDHALDANSALRITVK